MSVATGGPARRLDIGEALQDVFNVLGRNLGPFALLGIVLDGVPAALLYTSSDLAERNPVFILLGLLGLVAVFVARPILYGAVVFRTVRGLDGEAAPLGECLAAGRGRWGTLLGLMIWAGLLTGLGYIFLIAPGVFLALRWAVAGPSVVLSGRGISDSMAESAALTESQRWSMLLFYLIVLVGLFVAFLLLALAESALALVGSKLLITLVQRAFSSVLIDVSFPMVAAILYRRLRGDAAVAPTVALAEVFA